MTAATAGTALAEWVSLSEDLLRGLVHSLNNRMTALSAFGELAAMGDNDFTAEGVLPGELARLQQVSGLFRLLVSEVTPPEAMALGPVLDDAMALHVHHPRLRAVRCEVRRGDADLPVRVPRWAFLRLVLVMLEEGKRHAEQASLDVMQLRVSGNEQWIELHADGGGLTPYAVEMGRVCGATCDVGDASVRLPTLLELRRVERERRAAVSM